MNHLLKNVEASPATVRRDLQSLVENGHVLRTHGYVHSIAECEEILPFSARSALHVEDKDIIAGAAAEKVKDGMTVFLDSGSTTAAIARRIASQNITVVTNSIEICSLLLKGEAKAICCGGILEKSHLCLLGHDAEHFLDNIEVDIAFIGATGVRKNQGFTTSSPLQYEFKRRILKITNSKYVVFDQSKFYSANIYLFAKFNEVTGIITHAEENEYITSQFKSMSDYNLEVINCKS